MPKTITMSEATKKTAQIINVVIRLKFWQADLAKAKEWEKSRNYDYQDDDENLLADAWKDGVIDAYSYEVD